ncbi:MAG: ABC transporter permease [Verrucomicrobiales bacterium]|nr:ABC transporter permease [Verrucomicrobiales bacterium]
MATPPLRELVYTAESPMRRPALLVAAMLRDLWAARELAWRLFVRDLSSQYRQSVLGYFWAFVPPLLAALPWVFLNQQNIINVGPTGIPYPAFVMTGTMLWQTLIDAMNGPLRQTSAAKPMLAKIRFPREALLLAGLAGTGWNLLIRMSLLVPVLAYYGVRPSAMMLWAPLGLVAVVLLGYSVGLLLTPLGLLYNDVGRGMTVIAGFGMLLTPVVYPPPSSGIGGFLASWNPASPVVVVTRDWLTGQDPTATRVTAADFRDVRSLARKLAAQADPASATLWEVMSAEGRGVITRFLSDELTAAEAGPLVATALNRILETTALRGRPGFGPAVAGANAGVEEEAGRAQRRLLDAALVPELVGYRRDRFAVGFWVVLASSVVGLGVGWVAYRVAMPILIERMGG